MKKIYSFALEEDISGKFDDIIALLKNTTGFKYSRSQIVERLVEQEYSRLFIQEVLEK